MCDKDQGGQHYSGDLSTNEWQYLKPWVPAPKDGGRPAKYERLEILNATLYLVRTAVPGAFCLMTSLPGGLSIATFVMAP